MMDSTSSDVMNARGDSPDTPRSRFLEGHNPLLLRELLTTLRLRSVRAGVFVLPLLIGLVGLFAALITRHDVMLRTVGTGKVMLVVLTDVAAIFVLLVGAVLGTQAIAGERQRNTLELLTMTGMSEWRILWEKLAALWVALATMILACLPAFGVLFLTGGVTPFEVLVAVAGLVVLAPLTISIGLGLGATIRSPRLATVSAVVLCAMGAPIIMTLAPVATDLWADGHPLSQESAALAEGVLMTLLFIPSTVVIGLATWFFLAVSYVGLASPATDRARPLRWWLAVTGPTAALIALGLSVVFGRAEEELVFLLGASLGAFFTFSVVVLTAHPIPRARPSSPRQRLVLGPIGGPLFVLAVSAVSMVIYALPTAFFLDARIMAEILAMFAFLSACAGVGVLLASRFFPPLARTGVFVFAAIGAFGPLLAGAFFLDLGMDESTIPFWIAAGLSPGGVTLGFLARDDLGQANLGLPVALYSTLFWGLLAIVAWGLGVRRLRDSGAPRPADHEQQEAPSSTSASTSHD